MDNITEKQNSKSEKLNQLNSLDILNLINDEDSKITSSIKKNIPKINFLIKDIVKKMKNNGRLFYIGCGTSGRLGVLDASECPPTFGVSKDTVKGLIAGGDLALKESVENAEDSSLDGLKIIKEKKVSKDDTIIGISASGSAKYVHGALKEAKKRGATTAIISCNNINNRKYFDHLIIVILGPEVITGSTRMKAGTATKMILNMISTTVMIKLGHVYNNLMVDLKLKNKKLFNRALSIIMKIAKVDIEVAKKSLSESKGNIKIAIVISKFSNGFHEAEKLLKENNNSLDRILKSK